MKISLSILQTVLLVSFNLVMLCLTFRNRKKLFGAKFYFVIASGLAVTAVSSYYLSVFKVAAVWQYCYIVIYFLLTMLLCRLLFYCRLSECVFFYFVIQTYVDDTFMAAKVIQYYLLGRVTDNMFFFYPIQFALIAAGIPLIWRFSKEKLTGLADTTAGMRFWRYIWIMPLSFYIVYRIGISEQYVVLDSVWSDMNIMVPLFWAIATILAYYLVISTLLEVVKHVEDREKLAAAGRQLQMQKEQYQKLSESIEETRRMRHDLGHQMRAIAGYAGRGETEKLKEYVSSYLEQMESEELPLCENHALDSMIHFYIRTAKRENIRMNVILETLKELPCRENDVCVVLGNLLENALEACRRQASGERYIDLKLSTGSQNFIAIQVVNSCDDAVRQRSGTFLSAKRNYGSPGIGISSIKKIAERYRGSADFAYQDGKFQARIFLNRDLEK
ncbi:sensor histidine kinase [Clostridium transplantifaecale]|uniref:sensor histidine kinase n=1 Tax=Clostridium transplantifaecale TaxID=2479838 RepID=UPI000F63794D|nr:GHKL domain-containing protein [Clostridium transplantifaecale]